MEKNQNYDELPIITVPEKIILHKINRNLKIEKIKGSDIYKRLAKYDFKGIILATKTTNPTDIYNSEDFYKVGTIIQINNTQELNNTYQFNIDVIDRVVIDELIADDMYYKAKYHVLSDINDLNEIETEEVIKTIKKLVVEIGKEFKESEQFLSKIKNMTNITWISAKLFPYLRLTIPERQEFLELRSIKEKSLKIIELLNEQKETIKLQIEIATKVNEEMNKKQKEAILKEQLNVIQDELDGKERSSKKDYYTLINESGMPDDVKETALDEVSKLKRQTPHSPEENIIRTYLDTLVSLPWKKSESHDIDIKKARKILDEDQYGLDKIKDRIIQHLTVMKLKQNKQGSILLLVGPPGTGKTSLGKSIAKALERKYVRISLGGVKDESEIRGHRRTYLGALPGRIIKGMQKSKETNPVFVLDEVDKLMQSFNGDPASALLEVLDPEQNNTFSDNYLNVPYDLSDVFFIATANYLKDIPAPLKDRMEIIEIGSYTNHEKFNIAKNHLIPEVLEEHGLNTSQLDIIDDALKHVIENYTKEAGVRDLKRKIAAIARNTAEKVVLGEKMPHTVTTDMLYDILGREIIQNQNISQENPSGVVTGLAWTPMGGDILFIEGAFMPGTGKLTLTGQLGDVMKESATIAQTLIRSRMALSLESAQFDKKDLHIHVPSGAIPKDGPSAGIALLTTIASLVTDKKVDPKLAMTGEISLRGIVLPVGGIKEKVIGAHKAGIKKIILPKENKKDLDEIPDEIINEIEFIFVERIEEVIKETINIDLPDPFIININPNTIHRTSLG